jgi:hypothetical protein
MVDSQTLLACSSTFSSASRLTLSSASATASISAACRRCTSRRWRSQCSASPAGRATQRHAHAAAAVVADDDHVLDVQQVDGEVDHRQAVQIGVHDQVADIAVHEHFARRQPGDLVGRHAAVGAADPQVLGRLLAEQLGEVGRDRARVRAAPSCGCCRAVVAGVWVMAVPALGEEGPGRIRVHRISAPRNAARRFAPEAPADASRVAPDPGQ